MKVAFVSGTSVLNSNLFSSWEPRSIQTMYGEVHYKVQGEHLLLNRHGPKAPRPPHSINHRANIRALADLGFTEIVALNSVGSLQLDLAPGTFVACSDYVCLQQGPVTFFDEELRGGAPGIDNDLVPMLVEKLAPEVPVQTGKIYVQTRGPRFETKAEIRLIRSWGDVVGMTAAHEADLCREIGLHYNLFAMVDNYANGLRDQSIDFDLFRQQVIANQQKVNHFFTRLLDILR